MKLDYSVFRLAGIPITEDSNELVQILTAGELSLYCTLRFDTDSISATYNHWICQLDVISDTEDIPERSMTLYPNTVHFEGDELYSVAIVSNLDYIGHDDLQNAYIVIGVPSDE